MAIVNGYTDLDGLKSWADANNGAGMTSADDALLENVATAASRTVDHYCGRRFYLDTVVSAKRYRMSAPYVPIDDIGDLTGLVVETGSTDGATWTATTNYDLEPLNGTMDGEAWAYESVVLYDCSSRWWRTRTRPVLRVTARWGWPAVPAAVAQATVMMATRFFQRRTAWAGVAGFDASGVAVRLSKTDPDVAAMLDPYGPVGVG